MKKFLTLTLALLSAAVFACQYPELNTASGYMRYIYIAGVNDTDNELQALCDFCEGTLAHVNLIQLNEVEGSKFRPSTDLRAQDFVRRLASVGVEATVRNSRGSDIDAACGQLKQRALRGR